jgi:hypothetical protein
MALSDYLTGKNPFEESDDATVATVATVLRHLEEETAQQTSGSPATVATVAKVNGETPIKQNESIYIKSKNPFISDTKTLRHLRYLGSSPDISCAQTVASCCDTSATLATLECLKPDCSCTESDSSHCIFLAVAAWVTSCQPAQALTIPPDHTAQITELQTLANERIRWRHPTLRVWREGEDELCCKVFFGPESRSLPAKTADPPRRFQGRGRRIETMWSEEYQSWCSWNSESQDYVVDPELNQTQADDNATHAIGSVEALRT